MHLILFQSSNYPNRLRAEGEQRMQIPAATDFSTVPIVIWAMRLIAATRLLSRCRQRVKVNMAA